MDYCSANGSENVQNLNSGKSNSMAITEPNSLIKLNWLIHLQRVRGEISTCKELITNEIRKSGGRNEFAYHSQGLIYRQEGRIQDALESFQICMRLDPSNHDNIKEVARCLYEMHRYRLALEAYLEAERISNNPDWQIYYNIGECLMKLHDVVKAKEYAQKAVELGKQEAAYGLLMKILMADGDINGAISVSNTAIESCQDSVNMLTQSGLLYLKMGQTQNAFERLSSALALEPTSPKALLGIGCITQSYNEHEVALTKYKIAVSYNNDSVALWNNIGLCFHSKQKYIAAISCLKRALWLSPLNWRILFNLGLVHLATYQPASAFNYLCAAVNLRSDLSVPFTLLGCALMDLNDNDNALRAFRQAFTINPDDPLALINTAICLMHMNMTQEAAEMLKHLQELEERNVPVAKEITIVGEQLFVILNNEQCGGGGVVGGSKSDQINKNQTLDNGGNNNNNNTETTDGNVEDTSNGDQEMFQDPDEV